MIKILSFICMFLILTWVLLNVLIKMNMPSLINFIVSIILGVFAITIGVLFFLSIKHH